MELTAFSDIPPAPVVTPTLTCSLHWGFQRFAHPGPVELRQKQWDQWMKWVTCKTGRSRSNRKTLTLKEKIGLHTQIQKNSFPIENLTLSEQTCETNNIIQSSQWFIQSFVVAKAPVIWIPSTWVFESWWILLKIRNGSSYNIYIYTSTFVGWCWLKVLRNGRYKLLRKLFGGN